MWVTPFFFVGLDRLGGSLSLAFRRSCGKPVLWALAVCGFPGEPVTFLFEVALGGLFRLLKSFALPSGLRHSFAPVGALAAVLSWLLVFAQVEAVTILLLQHPFALMSSSFWFSFLCVLLCLMILLSPSGILLFLVDLLGSCWHLQGFF